MWRLPVLAGVLSGQEFFLQIGGRGSWFPTLRKMREGWSTRICGWGHENKRRVGGPPFAGFKNRGNVALARAVLSPAGLLSCKSTIQSERTCRPLGAGRERATVSCARGAICACCPPARDLASSAAISTGPPKILACLLDPSGSAHVGMIPNQPGFVAALHPPTGRSSPAATEPQPHNRTRRGDTT